MLNLEFFKQRGFSIAVSAVGLLMFGVIGSLFILTQFLQFNLGYSALQAGVRMLPIAAVMAVVAPLSAVLNRILGTKVTTSVGLLFAGAGLLTMSRASVDWSFLTMLPAMVMVGVGAALVMPSVSASVMNSVPRGDTGVGSATNGTFIQLGGAVGVAVVGSLLSTRYQSLMRQAIAPYHLPSAIANAMLGSIGGALGGGRKARWRDRPFDQHHRTLVIHRRRRSRTSAGCRRHIRRMSPHGYRIAHKTPSP